MLSRLAAAAAPSARAVRALSRRARTAEANAPPQLLVVQPRGPDADAELAEALRLCETLPGGDAAAHAVVQRVRAGAAATYFGAGTVADVAARVAAAGPANSLTVVVNCRLTGAQERNLSNAWDGARVLDRVGLIIRVFAARAVSAEAALQVELAALAHAASRLVRGVGGGFGVAGTAAVVSARQRGGQGAIGGEGEQELSLQRTRLAKRRALLTAQLADVARTRALHRARRVPGAPALLPDAGAPSPRLARCAAPPDAASPPARIAFVGYTNAGKSSLARALRGGGDGGDAAFAARDQLFSTLDTTTRGALLPSRRRALLSDTVGFVRALPPQLVAAFRSTLAEAAEADVIVHVIDASLPPREAAAQRAAVRDALRALGLSEGRLRQGMVEAYNKVDALPEDAWRPPPDAAWLALPVSAARGDGLLLLRHAIDAAAQLAACRTGGPVLDARTRHEQQQDADALEAAHAAAGRQPRAVAL